MRTARSDGLNANKTNYKKEYNPVTKNVSIMANFSIKTDLLKLTGAFVTNLKGKTATKRCLIIPVDDSGLYLGEKGVYLNMTAIEMREPKYSETHCVKVSLGKERYEAMTEEERRAQPIIGGMRQLERQAAEMTVTGTIDGTQAIADDEDLPF